jgi:ABC-2 type transport system ATP-binding protein
MHEMHSDHAVEAHGLVKTYPAPRSAAGRGAASKDVASDGTASHKKPRIRALNGLTLAVPRGTIFALVGPNGAGKSTTVKILTSLAIPDAGSALVEGIDALASPAAVRRVIGVVGQRSGADPGATGRENLILQGHLFGLRTKEAKRRADELLERFGLAPAAGRFVRGYSGGMQRRLDVALSLVHQPRVLFLDEPTTGLDPDARAAMWQEISRLAATGQLTVLLTTHYLEEADRLAGMVAIVDNGRVVAEGSPAELKERTGSQTLDDVYLHYAGRSFQMADDFGGPGGRPPGRQSTEVTHA